ncbi:hypothetical protein GURASL_25010 [Geotalea uraniireducens]|uniref:Ig-like domain-containing protein n=1 Tax=Geotalea uraniireducens TaxID=351604 RepID=A0ABM8EMP9_9BACT|nr:hypothetical protein [Geotalea uraniireducens]BDV43578.1 hypothetical protein GURASL_25010 [Geotalea uraniireducens]
MNRWKSLLAMVVLAWAVPVLAVPTGITVRVKSKDAKFIGTTMGGALITIRNAGTGELLAKGVTSGTTGNTDRLMRHPVTRGAVLSDTAAARFSTTIDITEPTLVEIKAVGPLARTHAAAAASVTQWLLPGKDLNSGDGVLLELPGLVLDILTPAVHTTLAAEELPTTVELRANLVMMCGCPVTKGGLWDAGRFEVRAIVKRNGAPLGEFPLAYAGEPDKFSGTLPLKDSGIYDITVYAFDPATGNTGVDRTTVVVEP